MTDQYSAAAVIDFLRRRGLSVAQRSMTATSKTDIFGELRARLYERTLVLPNHPALLAELRRLQTRFRAGSAAVTNPRVGWLARRHGPGARPGGLRARAWWRREHTEPTPADVRARMLCSRVRD